MSDQVALAGGAVEHEGLKAGALGLASATEVGVASTAPGDSLAASLGLVTAAVGFKAPAVMWISPADGVHRRRVLLSQPGRPRLREELHVGDPCDEPAHRLARRLELDDGRPKSPCRAFFNVKLDPIDRRPPPEGGEPLPPLVATNASR